MTRVVKRVVTHRPCTFERVKEWPSDWVWMQVVDTKHLRIEDLACSIPGGYTTRWVTISVIMPAFFTVLLMTP